MTLKNCAALFNIFCHDITPERDHSSMTYNVVIINSYIGCSTTDIHKDNPCLFFIIGKDCIGRGKRLKYHILYCKVCLPDALFDVLSSGHLSDHDMKICFESSA